VLADIIRPNLQPNGNATDEYARNFADSHPALTHNQALVESDRCYFCFDAPCIHACPTAIDIPSFIRKIATGNLQGAAHDILEQNIMGAVCGICLGLVGFFWMGSWMFGLVAGTSMFFALNTSAILGFWHLGHQTTTRSLWPIRYWRS